MISARFLVSALVVAAPLAACARQSAPPGGPPDNVPPVVVSTAPDTFAVVEPSEDPVTIRFSERISERPTEGASLTEAVVVSPATSAVEVEHGRRSLEISLERGWEGGRVYRVRVLPVVQDLFNNPMVSPFELVFSTGPGFDPGVVAGIVRDRITGEPVAGARVHAAGAGATDSVVYAARTDAGGIYTIRYLPPGPYDVTAFQDQNRNGTLNETEPRDVERISLESRADTLIVPLNVLAPDTSAARIVGVEAVDSATVRIDTDDFLDPAESLAPVEVTLRRDDGIAPGADSLLHAYEWEARIGLLEERAAADTAAPADTADTTAAVPGAPIPDSASADAVADARPPDRAEEAADTVAGVYGAGDPPRAERSLVVLLDGPLEPGVEHVVEVSGIRNIAGVEGGGGVDTLLWEPPPPDTAAPPPDTLAGDTTGPAPDAPATPDTAGPSPDTAGVVRDTAAVDTAGAVEEEAPPLLRDARRRRNPRRSWSDEGRSPLPWEADGGS